MSAPHLPPGTPLPPVLDTVVALHHDLGVVAGHRLVLLSLERWRGWADLRFARIDVGATQRLTRRVPPADAWRVHVDGTAVTVHDAVGRGDRTFSNGELRLLPAPPPGCELAVEVTVLPGAPPLTGRLTLPG